MRPPVPQYPTQASSFNLDYLHRDIEDLIARTKEDFVRDISNTELQTRLKALVDLQTLLRHQQLAPEALQAVRDQVKDLQMSSRPQMPAAAPMPLQNSMQSPMPSAVAGMPPMSYNTPAQTQYAPPPLVVPLQPTPEPQPFQPPSTSLANLLASVQRNMQPQPNGQTPSLPPIPPPQFSAQASTAPTGNPLLARLRAIGLLKDSGNGSTSITSTPPVSTPQAPPSQPQPVNLSDLLRQVATNPSKPSNPDHVELNSAALKM